MINCPGGGGGGEEGLKKKKGCKDLLMGKVFTSPLLQTQLQEAHMGACTCRAQSD